MPSRSSPDLGAYDEKPGLFQRIIVRPSTPKLALATPPPPLTFTQSSPPYDPFSPAPQKHPPLLHTRQSLPSHPPATAQQQACATSYPPRKSSLPVGAKGPFTVSATPIFTRLRSGLSRLFAKKGEDESEGSEADAASLHLELPEGVSRDKSEIEYLRRMEREALSGRGDGIVV